MASLRGGHVQSLINAVTDASSELQKAKRAEESARKNLQQAAERLSNSLRNPMETVRQMMFQPHQTLAMRIAIEGDWFRILASNDSPKTADEIATATGSDPLLIIRCMRILTVAGVVAESDVNTYTPTSTTRVLTEPRIYHGAIHLFDEFWASALQLPSLLRKNGFKAPTGPDAFVEAFKKTQWEYFRDNPERGRSFDIAMAGHGESRANWLWTYPFGERLLKGFKGEQNDVLFVDVAGGQGHDLHDLRMRYKDVPGRLVLQDLPHVLDKMSEEYKDGVEVMKYDFFTPQPIQGARAYHFRAIMHDWDDKTCQKILSNTVSAMEPGYSRILIQDFILPNTGAELLTAAMDLAMMVLMGGMERTEKQWHTLLESVGLEIIRIYSLEEGGEGVIEAAQKGSSLTESKANSDSHL